MNMNNVIKLPQGMIYEEKEIEISFPTDWQVKTFSGYTDEMAALDEKGFRNAFESPIGTSRIRELAKGKKEVAIVFDDITRGTRVGEIAPYILEELYHAGIKDEQIRFICALGAHGAHTRFEFVKKLGEEIVSKYPVFNHNPYENCTYLGNTSRGTPVSVNSELMHCDFKVSVGSIVPHPFFGFGGGGKILMPGVSSMETIIGNHELCANTMSGSGPNFTDGLGKFDNNIMREEMEEVCKMVCLDVMVGALVNYHCNTVGLVVGHPIEAFHSGVEIARKIYGINFEPNADIVVVNANFKANEAFIALMFGLKAVKPGGEIVVISHIPMGQVIHYVYSGFGRHIGGKLWNPQKGDMVKGVDKVVVYSPYRNYTDEEWFGGYGKVNWAETWDQVMEIIDNGKDPGTRVNVLSDATIQYYFNQ